MFEEEHFFALQKVIEANKPADWLGLAREELVSSVPYFSYKITVNFFNYFLQEQVLNFTLTLNFTRIQDTSNPCLFKLIKVFQETILTTESLQFKNFFLKEEFIYGKRQILYQFRAKILARI